MFWIRVCVYVNLCLWAKIQCVFVSAWLSVRNSLWLEWLDRSSYQSYSYRSSADLIFSSFSLSFSAVVIILHQNFCSSFTKATCPLESTNLILHSRGCKTHSEHRMRGPAGLDIENMSVCGGGVSVPKSNKSWENVQCAPLKGHFWLSFCFLTLPGELLYIFIWEEDTCSGMRRRKGGSINGRWQSGTFQDRRK